MSDECKYCDWLVNALEKHHGKYIEIIAAEIGEPFDLDKIDTIWEIITGHLITLPVEHFSIKFPKHSEQIARISLCNGRKIDVEPERLKEIMLIKNESMDAFTFENVDESLYCHCFSDEYKEYMINLSKAGKGKEIQ